METQGPTRCVTHLTDLGHGGTYLVEGGTQSGVKPFAGVSEVNASRRATDERHAEALLESPYGLADGGVCDGEAIRGRAKTLRFRDRHEGRHPVELVGHW